MITFGVGGYRPELPDGNIVARTPVTAAAFRVRERSLEDRVRELESRVAPPRRGDAWTVAGPEFE